MRKSLAVALLGAGLALTVPASPASADCNAVLYVLLGRCENACTLVADVYYTADAAAFDLLPDVPFACPA